MGKSPARTLALLLVAVVSLGCDADGTIVAADGGRDGGAADGGGDAAVDGAVEPTCAAPPVAAWQGEARRRFFGSGSAYEVRAEVSWSLLARDGCVDTFQPIGTATYLVEVATCASVVFDPPTAPIDHGEGRLLIDRATEPATYLVTGATSWPTVRTATCGDDDAVEIDEVVVGGTWVDASGALGDDAIIGGEGGAAHEYTWSFVAAP